MAGALAVAATGAWLLRPARVKALVERGLSDHLNLTTALTGLTVHVLPRPRIDGTGLTLRLPGRPDLPPFISIDRFSVDVGLLSTLRRHVGTVRAEGLHVAVPPAADRSGLPDEATLSPSPRGWMAGAVIDRFVSDNADLRFVPGNAGDAPLVFDIRHLEVSSVGFGREMPFTATLVNPVPRGLVIARGHVGPWQASDATNLPLAGDFTFADADLSTINGLGGRLDAAGRFTGVLTAVAVTGEATVRAFSLDLGGRPVPLTATFDTLVDGTDGTTVLKHVDAVLGSTPLRVTGAISNRPGPGRHDLELAVAVDERPGRRPAGARARRVHPGNHRRGDARRDGASAAGRFARSRSARDCRTTSASRMPRSEEASSGRSKT